MVKLFSTEHTFSHPFSRVSSAFWRKYPNENAPHVQAIDCYERKIIHLHPDGSTSLQPLESSLSTFSSPASTTLSSPPSSSSSSYLSASLSSSPSSLSSDLSAPDSPFLDTNTPSASPISTSPSTTTPTTTPLLVSNRIISCETALPAWLNRLGVSNHAYAIETSVINPLTNEMIVKSRNVTGASLMVMEETCTYKANRVDSGLTDYRQSAVITAFLPMFANKFEAFTLNNMTQKSAEGLATIETLCQRIAREVE